MGNSIRSVPGLIWKGEYGCLSLHDSLDSHPIPIWTKKSLRLNHRPSNYHSYGKPQETSEAPRKISGYLWFPLPWPQGSISSALWPPQIELRAADSTHLLTCQGLSLSPTKCWGFTDPQRFNQPDHLRIVEPGFLKTNHLHEHPQLSKIWRASSFQVVELKLSLIHPGPSSFFLLGQRRPCSSQEPNRMARAARSAADVHGTQKNRNWWYDELQNSEFHTMPIGNINSSWVLSEHVGTPMVSIAIWWGYHKRVSLLCPRGPSWFQWLGIMA